MHELDVYERRLERAFGRYVDGLPVEVDAMALVVRIADERERRARRWPALPRLGRAPATRAALIIVTAGLLLVALAGIALVAGRLHREPLPPQRGLVPTAVEPLQPDGLAYERTGVDGRGMVWAAGGGHVLRIDPRSGSVRTWTVRDDPSFGSAALAAPARDGGTWLIDGSTLRRLDLDGFAEVIEAPIQPNYLAEGPDGSLWITGMGEWRGVYRWDGSGWSSADGWTARINPGVIAVDRDGHPWVAAQTPADATSAGLWHFDGRTWAVVPDDAVAAPAGVTPPLAGLAEDIAAAPDGSMWVVTVRGAGSAAAVRTLLRFDGSSWTEFDPTALGFDPATVSIAADGTVWVTGDRPDDPPVRVARFDGRAWRTWDAAAVDGSPPLNATGVLARVAPARGATFLGTAEGVYRLAGDRWERAWPSSPVGPARVASMLAVSADEAWASDWTSSGAWRYRDGAWTPFTNGLAPGTVVRDLARAADGRLWAATDHGLATLEGERWTVVDPRPTRTLAIAPDGTLWIAGNAADPTAWASGVPLDGGIRTVRAGAAGRWIVEPVPTAGLGQSPIVAALAVDGQGVTWAATVTWSSGALARFDGRTWTTVRPLGGSVDVPVDRLVIDGSGNLWVLMADHHVADPAPNAVARSDGSDRWTVVHAADGLPGDPAWLEVGPDGQPWVSGSEGIARLDAGRWVTVHDSPPLRWEDRFAVAPDGTIWTDGPSMVGRIPATAP